MAGMRPRRRSQTARQLLVILGALHIDAHLGQIIERGAGAGPAEALEILRVDQPLDVRQRLLGLLFHVARGARVSEFTMLAVPEIQVVT